MTTTTTTTTTFILNVEFLVLKIYLLYFPKYYFFFTIKVAQSRTNSFNYSIKSVKKNRRVSQWLNYITLEPYMNSYQILSSASCVMNISIFIFLMHNINIISILVSKLCQLFFPPSITNNNKVYQIRLYFSSYYIMTSFIKCWIFGFKNIFISPSTIFFYNKKTGSSITH